MLVEWNIDKTRNFVISHGMLLILSLDFAVCLFSVIKIIKQLLESPRFLAIFVRMSQILSLSKQTIMKSQEMIMENSGNLA